MRILIAGASGAIGRALVRRLRANQHEVFALTQSRDSAAVLKEIGAEPVIADALDAAAMKAAVGQIRPDQYQSPCGASRCGCAPLPAAEFRILVCARLGAGDESVPLISSASPGVEAGARTYRELEARASATPGIEFVALRYGFFYGPGTWYTREGDMGDQVRQQQVPIIGDGQGVYRRYPRSRKRSASKTGSM